MPALFFYMNAGGDRSIAFSGKFGKELRLVCTMLRFFKIISADAQFRKTEQVNIILGIFLGKFFNMKHIFLASAFHNRQLNQSYFQHRQTSCPIRLYIFNNA